MPKALERPKPEMYVDTIDGWRAIAIILVMLFHFWQQTWLSHTIPIFGQVKLALDPFVVTGFLGVEILYVISGFCLFFPIAIRPDRKFSIRNFYYKRFVRIVPSYWLTIILCAIIGRQTQIFRAWPDMSELLSYMGKNMLFLNTFYPNVFYNSLNSVLWSVCVEVQFYLIFPLVLLAFRKWPYQTFFASFLMGETWRYVLREIWTFNNGSVPFYMNQLPGMIDTFVGGMLAAHILGELMRMRDRELKESMQPMFTLASIGFMVAVGMCMIWVFNRRYEQFGVQPRQLLVRMPLILATMGMIVTSALSKNWLRKVIANPICVWVAGISYQIYLWHQYLCLVLKKFNVMPAKTDPPMNDLQWQFPFEMLCIGVAIAAAAFLTYFFERPVSAFLLKHTPGFLKPRPPKPAPSLALAGGGGLALGEAPPMLDAAPSSEDAPTERISSDLTSADQDSSDQGSSERTSSDQKPGQQAPGV